jgi:CelD/BcsL family acetyltransferase involved in cellulose biosynthesis
MAGFRFVNDLDPLGGEWSHLAAQATNVFSTWEWASVWRKHFHPRDPMLTIVISRGEDPIGVVPLYRASGRPVRVIRVVGHGEGDELGLVCHEDDRTEVARTLRQALEEIPWAWDVFLGERFPSDEAWAQGLGARRLGLWSSPVLRFPGDNWDDFVRTRSANQRRQLSRFERSLRKDYRLSYRLANDRDLLSADLDLLFALHRARWRDASTVFSEHEPFHREFAAQALERGWLRLWFMELDGTAVAAWYGFRFAGVEFAYQSGRVPSLEDRSIGFVLLVHSMREALSDGIGEYRFLRGGEAYKGRFSNEDRELETIGASRGIVGAAALGAAGALERSHVGRAAMKARLRSGADAVRGRPR